MADIHIPTTPIQPHVVSSLMSAIKHGFENENRPLSKKNLALIKEILDYRFSLSIVDRWHVDDFESNVHLPPLPTQWALKIMQFLADPNQLNKPCISFDSFERRLDRELINKGFLRFRDLTVGQMFRDPHAYHPDYKNKVYFVIDPNLHEEFDPCETCSKMRYYNACPVNDNEGLVTFCGDAFVLPVNEHPQTPDDKNVPFGELKVGDRFENLFSGDNPNYRIWWTKTDPNPAKGLHACDFCGKLNPVNAKFPHGNEPGGYGAFCDQHYVSPLKDHVHG